MAKMVALFFASVAFISIMLKLLLDSIHFGSSDPLFILKVSLFGASVFGVIGFYLGRVLEEGKTALDSGRKTIKEKDKELIIDDILIYDVGLPAPKKPDAEQAAEQPKA